jgi:ankyrin repeat protein
MSQVTINTIANALADDESAPLASGPEDSHFQLPIRRALSTLGDVVDDSDDDDFLLNLENDSDSRNDSDDESWDAISTPRVEPIDDTRSQSGDVLESTSEIKPKFSEYDIREFYKSIERGDTAGVQEKLRKGMDVRREADNGLTPLVIAIKTCNIDMVRIILGRGATSKDFCQQLPAIAYAVMRDERALPILQHLLWSGANASAPFGPERYNLLHFAIDAGVLGVADFLINEGVYIESTCSKRRTYGYLNNSQIYWNHPERHIRLLATVQCTIDYFGFNQPVFALVQHV